MGKIHNVEKMTDNRFVNLYHVDATSVHNTPVSYYVASRANDVPSLKLKTGRNDPDGVIIYSIYGEKRDKVVLVRQYRYPMGEETLELPAGKLEPGEDPRDSGLRELAEETGLVPGTFEDMGCLYSSPGILAERIYLYFAKDLTQGPTHPDDGEFVETVWLPYQDLVDKARRGEIKDGKTLVGILKASFLLDAGQG